MNGKFITIAKDRAKNKSSLRTLPLVAPFKELLLRIKEEQAEQRRICGKSYCTEYLEYIYLDPVGKLIRPDFVTQHFALMLEKKNCRKIRIDSQEIFSRNHEKIADFHHHPEKKKSW